MLENDFLYFESRDAENAFIRLLLAYTYADIVRFKVLHSIVEELAGFSALWLESLVQIMLAVTLNNHKNTLVSDLSTCSPLLIRNLFNITPSRKRHAACSRGRQARSS